MPCVSDNGATAPISALTNAFSLGSNRGHRADDFGPRVIVPASREPRSWTAFGSRPDTERPGAVPQEDRGELQADCVRPDTGRHPNRLWTTSGLKRVPSVRPDDSLAEVIALRTPR